MKKEEKIIIAFILGGLIGASVALLYAPKSGAEIRKNIRKKTKEFKKKTIDAAESFYEEIEELYEVLKEKIKNVKDLWHELSMDTKKELLHQIEKISKMIEDKKKKLLESLID